MEVTRPAHDSLLPVVWFHGFVTITVPPSRDLQAAAADVASAPRTAPRCFWEAGRPGSWMLREGRCILGSPLQSKLLVSEQMISLVSVRTRVQGTKVQKIREP